MVSGRRKPYRRAAGQNGARKENHTDLGVYHVGCHRAGHEQRQSQPGQTSNDRNQQPDCASQFQYSRHGNEPLRYTPSCEFIDPFSGVQKLARTEHHEHDR